MISHLGPREAAPRTVQLRVDGLACGYGNGLVLRGVSFTLERGSFTGVLGPNGSGKTTLVTALARQLAERERRRVMLIVNDVGEIGIDGQLMRRLGTDVYELFGGCICCQLGSDLVASMKDVTSKYPVDLIMMEASGVAEPARIVDTVERYGPPGLAIKVLVLVDVTRWLEMRPALEPLLTGQVLVADQAGPRRAHRRHWRSAAGRLGSRGGRLCAVGPSGERHHQPHRTRRQ